MWIGEYRCGEKLRWEVKKSPIKPKKKKKKKEKRFSQGIERKTYRFDLRFTLDTFTVGGRMSWHGYSIPGHTV